MSDPFIGEIIMFGGNFAPRGWAYCDGQLLAINSNTALFSILGTMYGGDGRTSFGLPDLRGRSPKHAGGGAGPGLRGVRLGEKGGRETHQLSVSEMPSHSHPHSHVAKLHAEAAIADQRNPRGRMLATPAESIYADTNPNPNKEMLGESVTVEQDSTASGGSQSFSILDPYCGVNFIIALEGVFPSRS